METYKAVVAASGFYDHGFMQDEIASPTTSKFQRALKARGGKAQLKKSKMRGTRKATRKQVNSSKRKNR